jgi:Ala-tRNA(Pro) deacylase
MPVQRLKEFLDEHNVQYDVIPHEETFTAQQTAQATHIKGREVAKTVIVTIDGQHAMAVLPATQRIDLEKLKQVTGAQQVDLTSESEFKTLFPQCEVGAMPPFGNLYEMNTFVQQKLAEDERIAFNAGTHTEVIQLAYQDFADLVNPVLSDFARDGG